MRVSIRLLCNRVSTCTNRDGVCTSGRSSTSYVPAGEEEEEGAVAGACASAEGCCAAVRLHARTGRPPAAGEALLALRPKAGADAGKEEDEEGAASCAADLVVTASNAFSAKKLGLRLKGQQHCGDQAYAPN